MKRQKEDGERRGERREEDQEGAGTQLLGATATEKELDAEKAAGEGYWGPGGTTRASSALGVRVAHAARTPGDLGVCVETLVVAPQWLL